MTGNTGTGKVAMGAGEPSAIQRAAASSTLDDPRFQAIRDALAAVRSHAAPTRTTSHAAWEDDRGMNERVKRLRHRSETTQPYLDMERALIETATYLRYEGTVSTPELRGLVLRDYFALKTISIEPGELIVGEKGRGPQAAPTFPELCCHTLEDMRNMNDREQVNFTVTADDMAAQRDIVIPYWSGRASRDAIMRAQEPAWHDAYEAGIFTEFYEQRAGGHTCLGSERGVRAGFGEIRADIEAALAGLDYLSDEHAVATEAELLHAQLAELVRNEVGERWQVLPAVPCVLAKLRNTYRYHIVVKAPLDDDISAPLVRLFRTRKVTPAVNAAVDIDPMDLL